jgi:hypothetical protein
MGARRSASRLPTNLAKVGCTRDEHNTIIKHKTRLIAHSFVQREGVKL